MLAGVLYSQILFCGTLMPCSGRPKVPAESILGLERLRGMHAAGRYCSRLQCWAGSLWACDHNTCHARPFPMLESVDGKKA